MAKGILAAIFVAAVLSFASVSTQPYLGGAVAAVSSNLDPTVGIVTNTSTGSGVYIGNHIIISAGHIVDEGGVDANSIAVIVDHNGAPGKVVKAKPLWYSKAYDISAFYIDDVPADLGTATILANDAPIGTRIEVVGNPLGITFIHNWGHIAGISRRGGNTWARVQPVDVQFINGNSGGPAYVEGTHEVAGIVVGMTFQVMPKVGVLGTVKFIVPAPVVKHLLALHANDREPMPLPKIAKKK